MVDLITWMKYYTKLVERIQSRYPDVKIKYLKNYSFWEKMPKALKRLAFTLPNRIYMPAKVYDLGTLAHEYAHVVQQHEMGPIGFFHMYLSPQINAIIPLMMGTMALALGAPLITIICMVIAGICIVPWSSRPRLCLEKEGYMMDLAVEYWATGQITEESKKKVVDTLCSKTYYMMVWKQQTACQAVDDMVDHIINRPETMMDHIAFKDTYEILHDKTSVRPS